MTENYVQAFVDDLVKEIGDGIYDDELRRIARACFQRRGQFDKAVGVTDQDSVAEKVNDASRKVPDHHDSAPSYVDNATKPIADHFDNLPSAALVAVPPRVRVGSDCFTWSGKRYYRSTLEGKYILFPNRSDVSPKVRGAITTVDQVVSQTKGRSLLTVYRHDKKPQFEGRQFEVSRSQLMRYLQQSTGVATPA